MAEVTAAGRDGWRDCLAILAGGLAQDREGISAIMHACDPATVTGAFCSIVFELLRRLGDDPAQWVADEQERCRDELTWRDP